MLSKVEKKQLIVDSVGYLLEESLIDEMAEVAKIRETLAEEVIIHIGDKVQMFPIIYSGSIKVSRVDDDGKELLLYYIENGDSCMMTMQCCVQKIDSQIKATAIEASQLIMFPIRYMELWMDKYKSWREYILSGYHVRFRELIETVDAMAFMKLDQRLVKYLHDQVKLLGTTEITYTHQQIADDLHSSRVVVSRLLKQLENKGLIQLHRNRITVKNF
jgi:CRP/FNR family transcriptional regulator